MPMSGSAMAEEILLTMTSNGLIGTSTPLIARAIGVGAISAIVGTPFTTEDLGVSPGTSQGLGVGVKGVVASDVELFILASIQSKLGTIGTSTPIIAKAVADAFVNQLSVATLSSTQPLLNSGTAIITIGTLLPPASKIGASITSLGSSFAGLSWPALASAIGEGLAYGFKSATGNLTLTPTSPPPTTPIPGTPAKGTGSIS